MTNTQLLKERIEKSGLKKSYIATKLNLSYYGFMRKLNNKAEFKASEIQNLCSILEISNLKERQAIFFAV